MRRGEFLCDLWGMYETSDRNQLLGPARLKAQAFQKQDAVFAREEDGYLTGRHPDRVFEAFLEVEQALLIFGGKPQKAARAYLMARHAEKLRFESLVNLIWEERKRILLGAGLTPIGALELVYAKLEEKNENQNESA